MSEVRDQDDEFAKLLSSVDEELAGGGESDHSLGPILETSPNLQDRLLYAKECLWLLEKTWPRAQPFQGNLPETIGQFRIVRQLGIGGFGIVFLADDTRLNRLVALKVPHAMWIISRDAHRRFLREADTAARLNHPNIVAVYEVGEAGVIPYIASEFCNGPSLERWLAGPRAPARIPDAVGMMIKLADAVHHAHAHGVLHRDLKPSNILLSPQTIAPHDSHRELTEYAPKIADFGLAKVNERNDDATRSGAVLGTLAYLAPEQLDGRVRDINVQTDVYALGLILFELLSGRPLLRGETEAETIQNVTTNAPVGRKLFPSTVPIDLIAICQKCLERTSSRRYETAADLSADLRRFRDGAPVLARTVSRARRLWMWAKRYPAAAALAMISVLAIVTFIGGASVYNVYLNAALAHAERESAANRELLYSSSVRLAADAWLANGIAETVDSLAEVGPVRGQADLREFTWHYLWNFTHSERYTLRGHLGDVYRVEFSPDANQLVSAGRDMTARLWNADGGKLVRTFQHDAEVNSTTFTSADEMATASDDGRVTLWNIRTGKSRAVMNADDGPVYALAASRGRKFLASGGLGRKVHLWNSDSTQLIWSSAETAPVDSLAFSQDGRILISGHRDGSARWWRTRNAKLIQEEKPFRDWAVSVAHSPDLADVAVAGRSGELVTYRQVGQTWEQRRESELDAKSASIYSAAFSPRDNTMALGTRDGVIQLWNVRPNLVRSRDLPGHRERVWDVAWSHNGQLLASASADGTIKIWDVSQLVHHRRVYPRLSAEIASLQVSPNCEALLTGTVDGRIHLWNRNTQTPVCLADDKSKGFSGGCFVDRGRAALVMAPTTGLRRIDLLSNEVTVISPLAPLPCSMAVAANSLRLAIGCEHGIAKIFDVVTGIPQLQLNASALDVNCIALSEDGRRLATAGGTADIEIWNAKTGARERSLPVHDDRVLSLLFDATGDTLYSGGSDFTVRIWDIKSGDLKGRLIGQTGETTTMAISPDGRTLATGTRQPAGLRTWDLRTFQQLKAFRYVPDNVNAVAFTPDNRALIAAFGDTESGYLVEWPLDWSYDADETERVRVPLQPLVASGDGTEVPPGRLFQAVHNYAVRAGYLGGYPTCRRNDPGSSSIEVVLLRDHGIKSLLISLGDFDEANSLPRADYCDDNELVEGLLSNCDQWARTKGYLGALPTYFGSTTGKSAMSYEALVFCSPRYARKWFELDLRKTPMDVSQVFQAVHTQAASDGLVSAIPTFHQRPGLLACIAIPKGDGEVREIPISELTNP